MKGSAPSGQTARWQEEIGIFSEAECQTSWDWLLNPENGFMQRLKAVSPSRPLTRCQLNQYLTLSHQAPLSEGFFRYYWTQAPLQHKHPYRVQALPHYRDGWKKQAVIIAPQQLLWGLYRLHVDALLFFGNVRTAYRFLRTLDERRIKDFFGSKCFNATYLSERGAPLPLSEIDEGERHLNSEMVCAEYQRGGLKDDLVRCLDEHASRNGSQQISIEDLIGNSSIEKSRKELLLMAGDLIRSDEVTNVSQLQTTYDRAHRIFEAVHEKGLENSKTYLSMVNELDVYVATSMRTAEDFRGVAELCRSVFRHPDLQELNLRYFDPTMSVARNHVDKGLIECLMVKCSKALIYCHGEKPGKDSFGKDAEAAMALSLGKPVILYSPEKHGLFRDIHPLTRMIEFGSGVAVGAMVTKDWEEIPVLLNEVLTNDLKFELERDPVDRSLVLREKRTRSVVRYQTSDALVRETFWNHYHNQI